jgi:hypothetical protein
MKRFVSLLVLGGGLAFGAVGCSESEPTGNGGSSGGGGGQAGTATAGKGGASSGSGGTGGGAGTAGSGSGTAGAANGGAGGSSGGGSGAGGSNASGTGGAGGGSGGSAGAETGGSAGAGDGGTTGNEAGAGGTAGEGASSGSGASGGSAGTPAGGGADVFGIEQLYPSAPSGAEWTSAHWDGGEAYSITSREDENDPLGISGMRGTGTLEVTGDGELVMGGSQPRIYIYPSDAGPWQNLEITAYYQRVEDSATAYAGLVIGARSGPDGHSSGTECDAHTYYARVRNDGAFDFEKELEHPASATQSRVDPETAWPPDGEVPFDTWIGFKFVIYNLDGGSVKLEAYRDMTNGENGGTWEKVNETVDDGGWSVETTCAEHSPSGGESDLIVTEGGTTFIRNTEVTEARYRWVTVREITAP